MSSQALRSAYSQARPELERMRLPLRNYFRHFSTTQPQRADSENDGRGGNNKQSLRERAALAVNQMNSLVQKRSNPAEKREQSAEGADRPRVIDVRSLPRGLGWGGLRGRGGVAGSASGATRVASPGNRFSLGNRSAPTRGGMTGAGRVSRRGGGGGGGGGPGPGRGGKRFGARTGKPKPKEDGSDKAPLGPRGKRQDPFEQMDTAEKAFDDAMRFGTKTAYAPADLTLESLAAFFPAVPTSAEGQRAAVMQNLSVLGTGDPIGVPQNFQARSYAEEVERNGIRFFADLKDKDAAERYLQEKKKQQRQQQQEDGQDGQTESAATDSEPIIQGAEEAIQKVILDRAVAGTHEKPKFAQAEDVVGLARSWHLRAETYTQQDVDKFEKKLSSVLAMTGKRAQGQPTAKT